MANCAWIPWRGGKFIARPGLPGLDFETRDATNLVRAGSERLAAPQVLFFLFFDGALGVG
jgi:hypothetical protein